MSRAAAMVPRRGQAAPGAAACDGPLPVRPSAELRNSAPRSVLLDFLIYCIYFWRGVVLITGLCRSTLSPGGRAGACGRRAARLAPRTGWRQAPQGPRPRAGAVRHALHLSAAPAACAYFCCRPMQRARCSWRLNAAKTAAASGAAVPAQPDRAA